MGAGAVHLAEVVIVHQTFREAVQLVSVIGLDVMGGVQEILVIHRQYHGGVKSSITLENIPNPILLNFDRQHKPQTKEEIIQLLLKIRLNIHPYHTFVS